MSDVSVKSFFGGAVQSSVFEVEDKEPKFIGIVSAGTRLKYVAQPGKRRFMVIGENASFLDGDLLAGRTYYARVSPRMGVWKARFVLEAITKADIKEGVLKDECSSCDWVGNTPESHKWASDHSRGIQSKLTEYLGEWEKEEDRARLVQGDYAN